MLRMQEGFSHLQISEPIRLAVADECPTCGGSKVIRVERGKPIVWEDGTQMPIFDDMPCPDCCPTCLVCGGMGYITYTLPVGHPEFGKLHPCPNECQAVAENAARCKHNAIVYSRLPAEYQHLNFESFEALPERYLDGKRAGLMTARAFVAAANGGNYYVDRADIARLWREQAPEDWRNWIVFFGEHGRGKTGLAASIVNALTDMKHQVRYIRLQDYVFAVQKRYDREKRSGDDMAADEFGDKTSAEVQEEVIRAGVLVVDEFDVPDIRENKLALVEKLIRFRHGEHLPTVITTNLDPDGFERRWGPTIASVTLARAHWVPMRGLSLRGSVGSFDWE